MPTVPTICLINPMHSCVRIDLELNLKSAEPSEVADIVKEFGITPEQAKICAGCSRIFTEREAG